MNGILPWVGFNLFVLAMLALDLGLFNRKAHVVEIKEALVWTGIWITQALLFNLGIYFRLGPDPALEFLTGYLIEKALSVDNIFVFLLIFSYFEVPLLYQHKVLFWGILGALLMRACFIMAGITLIEKFHWVVYLFGGFLILTGIKIAFEKQREARPERNPVLKLFRRWIPVSENYHNGNFIIKKDARYLATPLAVVLLVVETTDIVFAVDSIPAILAISQNPFIVYTSNVFAILGLRALYFALAGMLRLFQYLHYGLAAILVFVGLKMIVSSVWKIPIGIALGAVAGILLISVLASILRARKQG